jgi:outer membrane protein TolC
MFGQPPNSDKKAIVQTQDKIPTEPGKPSAAATQLSLAECIAIAHERQPTIRAARAALGAAEAGQQALLNIHPFTTILARDLPFRRDQAARGVIVAAAEVRKAEVEVTHDVTYLYYSYVYARQQEQTVTEVQLQLEVFYEIAEDLVKAGSERVNQFTIYTLQEAIAEVKRLQIDAVTGQQLALAALKEAMGVEQSFDFVPRDTELPVMGGTVTQEQVVALALAGRSELLQAENGVDVFRLEACAQGQVRFRQTVPTFASGSDLHARIIPGPLRNGEYRPGALAPEMPTTLVGRREDRVARAYAYSARQDEVYAKTRNLIELEAINSYLAWKAATEKMAIAKDRFERSLRAAKLGREAARDTDLPIETLVRNEALAGRAQGDYLTAVIEHIRSLARLQRVTGGGVVPAFPVR